MIPACISYLIATSAALPWRRNMKIVQINKTKCVGFGSTRFSAADSQWNSLPQIFLHKYTTSVLDDLLGGTFTSVLSEKSTTKLLWDFQNLRSPLRKLRETNKKLQKKILYRENLPCNKLQKCNIYECFCGEYSFSNSGKLMNQ